MKQVGFPTNLDIVPLFMVPFTSHGRNLFYIFYFLNQQENHLYYLGNEIQRRKKVNYFFIINLLFSHPPIFLGPN